MRFSLHLHFVVLLLACSSLAADSASQSSVKKVLPHFLDQKGRHALSPSLYERDAYQAELRENPQLRSTVRFDVLWDSAVSPQDAFSLKVEMRGAKENRIEPFVLKTPLRSPRWFGSWTKITVPPDDYKRLGDIVAWRITLWDGDDLLASEESFLWSGEKSTPKGPTVQ